MRRAAQVTEANRLKAYLRQSLQRSVPLAAERGASTWLSALPLAAYGFHLSKSEFWDAIHLRYGWPPPNLPLQCACGKSFDANHALSCPTGGLRTINHNEIRDLCAVALTGVCHDVATEPDLEPRQGEKFHSASTSTMDGAELDISASGLRGDGLNALFLMFRCLTPTCNRTFSPVSQASTVATSARNELNTSSGFVMWKDALSARSLGRHRAALDQQQHAS